VQLNWKTRLCEIDIVAQKQQVMYLIEVKYRRTSGQGYGLDYITPKKLEQMRFAAEIWAHNTKWRGSYQLAAIGIDGDEISFIDQLDV
jgi:Holliday junction resolvase-like predicted endonuclease